MSIYQVQKLIQAVNRDATAREQFFSSRESFVDAFALTALERAAVMEVDILGLYEMGVHPLLLRPFTIINGVSEPDYLDALRGGD